MLPTRFSGSDEFLNNNIKIVSINSKNVLEIGPELDYTLRLVNPGVVFGGWGDVCMCT